MTTDAITLRTAAQADFAELATLAQLDSQALPPAPHLVAERGGRIVAALSETSGAAVADPFLPTAETVVLLSAWAARRRPGRSRRPHLARRPRVALA